MATKTYHVVETHDINTPEETRTYTIRTTCPTTNMSGEELDNGWLGTTNDIWRYAHGAFDTIEAARALIQEKMPGAEQLGNDDPESDDEIWGHDPESLWLAADWLGNSTDDEIGLHAGMTATEVDALATEIEAEAAEHDSIIITDSVESFLQRRLDDMPRPVGNSRGPLPAASRVQQKTFGFYVSKAMTADDVDTRLAKLREMALAFLNE
jgi:hypothetical protein